MKSVSDTYEEVPTPSEHTNDAKAILTHYNDSK